MSTTDQLIAKAMSTTSEDEAIACLRMARKKGGKVTQSFGQKSEEVTYNGHTAKYWYEKALAYYNYHKQNNNSADYRTLKYLYDNLSIEHRNLMNKEYALKRKARELQSSVNTMKIVIGGMIVMFISVLPMVFR
jgi:uncharacterized protein (DUF3084 family)